MKISEMSWEQGREAMLRLAAPIANICDDENLATELKDFLARRNLPNIMSYGKLIPNLLALVLKDHEAEVEEIVEVLLDIPKAKIKEHGFVEIVNGLRDSWDEVLRDFFTRSSTATKKNATE